jgi:hypothetical protein
MKVDAVKMAKEFYEMRNPTMRWSRLTLDEKIHMAVLAERSACMRICREQALNAFDRGYPYIVEGAITECINEMRDRGAQ